MQPCKIYALLLFAAFFACQPASQPAQKASDLQGVELLPISQNPVSKFELDSVNRLVYSWLHNYNIQNSLAAQINTPIGFKRLPLKPGSFGEWLRYLPLKPSGTAVKLYNGNLKGNQELHAAVIDIDAGKSDLQQCADAVMRLRAEYFYSQKAVDEIHFNFTSGHKVSFADWSRGRKPVIQANEVSFSQPGSTQDTSYSNFKAYLRSIFTYAGTASLSKELQTVPLTDLQIGDVFIEGGFPGHAVIVLDMASDAAGNKVFLLGQGYMPAQDVHVLKNFMNESISPWYSVSFGEILNTPEWTFKAVDLKRFR